MDPQMIQTKEHHTSTSQIFEQNQQAEYFNASLGTSSFSLNKQNRKMQIIILFIVVLVSLTLAYSLAASYNSQSQANQKIFLKKLQIDDINKIRAKGYQQYLDEEQKKSKYLKGEQESLDKFKKENPHLSGYYNVDLPSRTKLGSPNVAENLFDVWKFQRIGKKVKGTNGCVLINSVSIVTQNTINTIEKLMQIQQFELIFLIISHYDYQGEYLIQKKLNQTNKYKEQVYFDADYIFTTKIKNQCSKIAYMFGNFFVNHQLVKNIEEQMINLQPSSLFFTSFYQSSNNKYISLSNLAKEDLSVFPSQKFNMYLYIFDTEFLSIITPLNFVFFSKYTIEQAILIPILVLYQSANKMFTNQKIFHGIAVSFLKFKQFTLKSILKQNNSICFISYPNNPSVISTSNVLQYFTSIKEQLSLKSNEDIVKLSVILYLPYQYEKTPQLYSFARQLIILKKQNSHLRIRLRLQNLKAVSSYAVYDSVYTYCPDKSLIISSRHNVRFQKKMTQIVSKFVSQRYHYYVFAVEKQNSEIVKFQKNYNYGDEVQKKNWKIFDQKLKFVQVFKSDLFKTGVFNVLKSQQVDFYESEASFVIHMMKLTRLQIGIINQTLVKYITRQESEQQLKQIRIVKSYGRFDGLVYNKLMPYRYSSLQNQVLRRNAPKKMTPIIHQIWFSEQKISRIRMALRDTLIAKNPNFTVHLWTKKNLTRSNAPYTFDLIERMLQNHKTYPSSLYAMIADIFRYQLLVTYGGIYLDFKFQGVKSLDNFLKYDNLFTDFDSTIIRFGIPQAMGNPVIGATQNNYYLRYILNELIKQERFQFIENIIFVTGSYLIRKSVTDKQLFTALGFGFNFFFPRPYEPLVNQCGGFDKKFDKDQEVFQINNFLNSPKPIKMGVPCKQYPGSYIINYNPLSHTWVGKKRSTN